MKLFFLVIDGAFDRLSVKSALSIANKPNLDRLAKMSRLGTMYPIGKGIAPESDSAVISILGYNPDEGYTGRGPLEALGVGLRIREGYEVAFRANFATVEPKSMKIVDRRCGRSLSDEESKELACSIDNLKIDIYDGYARTVSTIGYRAVVVIGSENNQLSDNVQNTDPAYVKVGKISEALKSFDMQVRESVALDDTAEAKVTAELVNTFVRKSVEILDAHEVNVRREAKGLPKANCLLMRDPGASLPKFECIDRKFGFRFGAVAEMPVEKGIVKALGMRSAEIPITTKWVERYSKMLRASLKLLSDSDVVYAHLKGPDEPGHEGSLFEKVSSIEAIDEHFVRPLMESIDLTKTAILVTSDHATPWIDRGHSADPVGVMLYVPHLKGDGFERFDEESCSKGSLGTIEHGWELLPSVFSLLNKTA
ncbi:MAG: alkaline phosphatase family protein [Candidatus Bathyarchaeia archaeon]